METEIYDEILWALDYLMQELEEHHGHDRDIEADYNRADQIRRAFAKERFHKKGK